MNITTIKKRNEDAGFTFFDSERLKLNKAKVLIKVFEGNGHTLFILSRSGYTGTEYVLCEFNRSTGYVGAFSGMLPYKSQSDAEKFANLITKSKKAATKKKTKKKKSLKPKKENKKK